MPKTFKEALNQVDYAIREAIEYVKDREDTENADCTPYHRWVLETLQTTLDGNVAHEEFRKGMKP